MTQLAFEDTGGPGPLVVLVPGAGDVRSEYRRLAPILQSRGLRVVTADLPGHGDSPVQGSYGVAEAAAALLELIEELDAGPAILVGCSFAPAAAVWATTDRPELVRAVGLLSPHMDEAGGLAATLQRRSMQVMFRGPIAGPIWARLYRSWYKAYVPEDLQAEIAKMSAMLADPERRRAVRDTLTASRDGLSERMDRFDRPSFVAFGTADDHFADPMGEAKRLAQRLGSSVVLVEGAGHYPHVEQPEPVAEAVADLVAATS